MRSARRPNATFGSAAAVVVSAAAILWYAWPRRSPHIIAWDVFGYYLYLPLFFIRGDLGLSDPAWVHDLIARYQNTATFYQAIPVGNGNMVLKYSMGMAVLYSPFFFIGHAIALLTGQPVDGLSAPYEWSMFAGSMTYTFTGLVLLRALLLRFFSDGIAAAVILLIALGTNYYATNAVTLAMSHVPLFALYCALLLVTMDWERAPTPARSVALGGVIGLMGLARPSEVVAALIPLLWGVSGWESLRTRIRVLIVDRWRAVALAIGTAIAVGLPQVVYWRTYTGRFLFYSYVNPGEGFDFLHPYLAAVLFSFRKGWYVYTPLMAVATAGFISMARGAAISSFPCSSSFSSTCTSCRVGAAGGTRRASGNGPWFSRIPSWRSHSASPSRRCRARRFGNGRWPLCCWRVWSASTIFRCGRCTAASSMAAG